MYLNFNHYQSCVGGGLTVCNSFEVSSSTPDLKQGADSVVYLYLCCDLLIVVVLSP